MTVRSIEVTAFRRDARVKIFSDYVPCGGRRGIVLSLSDASRRRFLFQLFNASCDWFAFGTLTYPSDFPTDGLKVREDRRKFGQWLRRRGFQFATVLEFQERGAPHFHFVIDGFLPKEDLSRRWFEIVGSGDEKHLWAGTRIEFCGRSEQAMRYMASIYAAKKNQQKQVPEGYKNVGRFWTTSRSLVQPVRSEIELPNCVMVQKVRALRKLVLANLKKQYGKKVVPKNFRRASFRGFTVYHGSQPAIRLIGK